MKCFNDIKVKFLLSWSDNNYVIGNWKLIDSSIISLHAIFMFHLFCFFKSLKDLNNSHQSQKHHISKSLDDRDLDKIQLSELR